MKEFFSFRDLLSLTSSSSNVTPLPLSDDPNFDFPIAKSDVFTSHIEQLDLEPPSFGKKKSHHFPY
jgi:hypothetical protein